MLEDKVKNKSCPDILTSLNGESSPGTEALTFRLRVSLGDNSVRVTSSAGPQYTHLVPENKMARFVMVWYVYVVSKLMHQLETFIAYLHKNISLSSIA